MRGVITGRALLEDCSKQRIFLSVLQQTARALVIECRRSKGQCEFLGNRPGLSDAIGGLRNFEISNLKGSRRV